MTDKIYIYGKHAVEEALHNTPAAVAEVFTGPVFSDAALLSLAKSKNIAIVKRLPVKIDPEAVHQGIAAAVFIDKLIVNFENFLENISVTPDTALAVLDELQDPHNVGAVIRSAAAFGLSGVLMPERKGAPLSSAAVKVSAGMAFRVPIVSVGNINMAVRALKDHGFFVYGLSGEARHNTVKEDFTLPSVFILGSESEGIREKTSELCDKLLAIPMSPKCESLNAAAAASVAFYAWSAKHAQALR